MPLAKGTTNNTHVPITSTKNNFDCLFWLAVFISTSLLALLNAPTVPRFYPDRKPPRSQMQCDAPTALEWKSLLGAGKRQKNYLMAARGKFPCEERQDALGAARSKGRREQ